MLPHCWPFEPVPSPKDCECLRDAALKTHYAWYVERVRRLNEALRLQPCYRPYTLGALYCDLRGEGCRELRRLAGCVYMHELFFGELGKECSPKGRFRVVLDACFGSFDAFRVEFDKAVKSLPLPGSVWLVLRRDHSLCILSCLFCNRPCEQDGCPLLVLDVWEHAWMLRFPTVDAYLETFWRCVNWGVVEERYLRCCCRL